MIRNGETFLVGSPEGAETYRTRLDAGLLACVQDSANLNYLAAVAPGQFITLFGNGLGPAPGSRRRGRGGPTSGRGGRNSGEL